MQRPVHFILTMATFVFLLIAALVWIRGIHHSQQTQLAIQQLQQEKRFYQSLEDRMHHNKQTRQALQEIRPSTRTLPEIMEQTLVGLKASKLTQEDLDLPFGFRFLQRRVVFDSIPIREAMRFVSNARRQQPPWRLDAIEIRAQQPLSTGVGTVRLDLSTIYPSPPATDTAP